MLKDHGMSCEFSGVCRPAEETGSPSVSVSRSTGMRVMPDQSHPSHPAHPGESVQTRGCCLPSLLFLTLLLNGVDRSP